MKCNLCVYIHNIYIYTKWNVCVSIYTYIYVCLYTYIHNIYTQNVCLYTYIYICVCLYTYRHTHTHTDAHCLNI